MEQESINPSAISESQAPSLDEKNCRYCRTSIHPDASVCQHCRYHQRWWLNYFRFEQFGVLVSIGLLALSFWQFTVALEQRTKADEALQRASQVEELAKQTRSLLDFNLLLTKASHDDRKALDDAWRISQTPQHAFQDLGRGAVHAILMSNIPLTPDPTLVERLRGLTYESFLEYYQNNPHQGPAVLHAVGGNAQMTEERKADFIARMIAEDPSVRVVQWACLFMRNRLETYQQANPVSHDRVVTQC
jgi:hypothetical protein